MDDYASEAAVTKNGRRHDGSRPAPGQALLIGGMPRSGTTVICDILNEAEEVAIWAEYPLDALVRELSRLLDYGRNQTRGLSAKHIRDNLAAGLGAGDPGDQTGLAALEENDIYHMHGSRGLAYPRRFPLEDRIPAIVASVISSAVCKSDVAIFGTKDPLFFKTSDMREILRHFPGIKFIMCIRAPLDQINSSANRRNRTMVGLDQWENRSVAEMVDDYTGIVRDIVGYAARFDERVLIVNYDDLLSKSRNVFTALEKFLGVDLYHLKSLVSANDQSRNILSEAERESVAEAFGSIALDWASAPLTGTGLGVAHHLAPFLYGDIEPAQAVRYDGPGERRCLGHGWGEWEDNGRWSIEEAAELIFAVSTTGPRLIALDVAAYLPSISSRVRCRILMNDHVLFDGFLCRGTHASHDAAGPAIIALPAAGATDTIMLGPVAVEGERLNVVRLQFPGVQSPLSAGTGADPRRLAIKLRQFGLIDLTHSD